ncbi:ABC transporter permease [Ekhidna sp.]
MLRNFFLITFRNILKNKGSSYLNISCLTMSMGICLFIFHFIYYETTYDSLPEEANVYRVETSSSGNNDIQNQSALTLLNAAPFLKNHFNSIVDYTRLVSFSEEGTGLFRNILNDSTETRIYMRKVFYAEPSIFKVFQLPIINGNKETCLIESNSIIISAEMAQKWFKKEFSSGISILGKKLKSPGIGDVVEEYVVTGIFKNRPENTHLKFDALVSKSMSHQRTHEIQNTHSYITTNVSIPQLNTGVPYVENGNSTFLTIRPINEIHLSSNVSGNPEPSVSKRLIFFLIIIGSILLILASTNHINNTIFNSIDRAKEIGVRKLLGIKPKQLFVSFIGEAFLINLISILLAIILFIVGAQIIHIQTDIGYPPLEAGNPNLYLLSLLILLVVSTLLSGLYPAFYLTSLSPISSLKNKYELMGSKQFSSAGRIIRLLLIFQLGVSICFLSGVYIVYLQMTHLKQKGSSPMQLSITGIFPGTSGAGEKFSEEAFYELNEYQKTEALESYTISNLYKGEVKTKQWIELDSTKNVVKLSVVDHGYISRSGLTFLSGRNFYDTFGKDADNAIISYSAMMKAGYSSPDSILNQILVSKGSRWKVIGVVKDNNQESEIFVTGFRYRTYVDVVLNYPGGKGETLDQFLDKNQYYLSLGLPFFSLFKRNYQNQDKNEKNVMNMFLFFSIMTLIIANMGMFGLSSFVVQKRQKEIGIRKVLGAESIHILILLITDFLKLVSIASVIAIPFVLVSSRKWLEDYVYRIAIEPSMIMLPLLVVLVIALAVVGEKCFKLAISSPIESLKG